MEINDILADVKKVLDEIDRLNKEIGILVDLRDGSLNKIQQLEELFGSFRTQKILDVEDATNNNKYKKYHEAVPKFNTELADIFMRIVDTLVAIESTAWFTVAAVYDASAEISDHFDKNRISWCVHRYIKCGFIEKVAYKEYGLTSEGMKYYQENKHRHRAMLQD